MTLTHAEKAAVESLGDPKEIDLELQRFRRGALLLSSRRARLIEHYMKRWVAVYQGKVMADGATFSSVLQQVDEKKLPRGQVILRYIDKGERTLIL